VAVTTEQPPAGAAPSATAGGPGRSLSRFLHHRPRTRLFALLGAPAAWLLILYIGALAALLVTSVWTTDPFTSEIVKDFTLDNLRTVFTDSTYVRIALRTVGVAAAVTVIDAVIAVPMAFYMGKVAPPRLRPFLVVMVLVPLWAGYLVKAYAWRAVLNPASGVLESTVGWSPGFGLSATVIVLAYLWLPYMILPIYAGFERLPDSLLEASADLGGKAGRTFVSVAMPIVAPSIIAGSIFTFSLSMGDYIAVQIVGGTTQMIGNVIYRDFGASNIPFAAAFAVVPVLVMVLYLALVRRTGALENL
jgi:putative spermidine/putrescine transport system permease protein